MIVKPSVGFDQVKFGMTELEVIALLGKPDLIAVDEDDDDQNIVYQYNDLKAKLTFYTNENNRLSYIRTTNPNAVINNINIIDQPLKKVFGKKNYTFRSMLISIKKCGLLFMKNLAGLQLLKWEQLTLTIQMK